jgi:FAD-dependent urate hydroxylase
MVALGIRRIFFPFDALGGPMRLSDVCVIGAGPYGLTATAHLRAAGADVITFGDVMSFWRTMPAGMLLRSSREAISLADPSQDLSLDDFERTQSVPLTTPVARADFVRYGEWFQRHAVPSVDPRRVEFIERDDEGFLICLSDGEVVQTKRVIVATGLASFTHRLPVFRDLPLDLVSHSLDPRDCSQFQNRKVMIVGSGQSALEAAAMLNSAGASVELVARNDQIHWLAQSPEPANERGLLEHLLYPPGAIGPPGINWVVKLPWLYRSLPPSLRQPIFRRAVRPAGSDWIRDRFHGVVETFGRSVVTATTTGDRVRVALSDGTDRVVDHVVQGTGFAIDVQRFSFLSDQIVKSLRTIGGQPRLGAGFQSSVPGLHFLGAASDLSYGPLMRAIAGTGYAARAVTRSVVAGLDTVEAMPWMRRSAALEQGLSRVPTLVGTSPAAAAGIALVIHTLSGDPLIFPSDH